MTRREAIATLFALVTAAAPLSARAQARVIGYLSLEAAPKPYPTPEQWRGRSVSVLMRNVGGDEGTNLVVERAYAELDAQRLPELARAIIGKGVEVIVANGPEATLAAARTTATIPIVSFNLVWPEEQGLVQSLAR